MYVTEICFAGEGSAAEGQTTRAIGPLDRACRCVTARARVHACFEHAQQRESHERTSYSVGAKHVVRHAGFGRGWSAVALDSTECDPPMPGEVVCAGRSGRGTTRPTAKSPRTGGRERVDAPVGICRSQLRDSFSAAVGAPLVTHAADAVVAMTVERACADTQPSKHLARSSHERAARPSLTLRHTCSPSCLQHALISMLGWSRRLVLSCLALAFGPEVSDAPHPCSLQPAGARCWSVPGLQQVQLLQLRLTRSSLRLWPGPEEDTVSYLRRAACGCEAC